MKVAIVGGSPSTQMDAPFDSDFEVWVLGNQLDQYQGKKISRVFEIHDDLSEHPEAYPRWLVNHKIPLIVSDKFPIKDKHITVFPEKDANDLLKGEYLSSSPAYMMAYALLEGAKEIEIYGVDMAVDDHEYFKQRPEMYAWIGLAKGMGVKVTVPGESPLFKGGYVEGRDWGIKSDGTFSESAFLKMADAHKNSIIKLESEIQHKQKLIDTHAGAQQAYERLAKVARAKSSGCDVSLINSAVIK